ncbi:radical SAM protein [Streptomyces sp. NPDC017202]|uniref:radical SAM protein n=1 Tax=Streptomyces sp. NPDC017202 TaxID=3364981 RepID=UPI0037BB4F5A
MGRSVTPDTGSGAVAGEEHKRKRSARRPPDFRDRPDPAALPALSGRTPLMGHRLRRTPTAQQSGRTHHPRRSRTDRPGHHLRLSAALRCVHCHSESGRRPARQRDLDGMLRVADGPIAPGPDSIALAGGEPLLAKGVFEVAERLARAGIEVILCTGGWSLEPWMTEPAARLFFRGSVSVDGGTPEAHDRLRGRARLRPPPARPAGRTASRPGRDRNGRGPRPRHRTQRRPRLPPAPPPRRTTPVAARCAHRSLPGGRPPLTGRPGRHP